MKKIWSILLFSMPLVAFAQYEPENVKRYVVEYKDYAVKLMREEFIPASVRLAQAIYATEAGTNKLYAEANNHFALACPDDYQGNSFTLKEGPAKNCYLSYRYPAASYADHSLFLRKNSRFAPLFHLELTDYKGWARGLQQGKYNGDPGYAQTLINVIESYGLARFDTIALQGMEETGPSASREVYYESGIEVRMEKKMKSDMEAKEESCGKDSLKVEILEEGDPLLAVFRAKGTDYPVVYYPHAQRNVYENNKVKFVLAKEGETYAEIAREMRVLESAIRRHNDIFDQSLKPVEGEVVYIEEKNKKSPVQYHTIVQGESARYIAQKYAVPLSLLFERNQETYDAFGVGNEICISCKNNDVR